MIHSLRLDTADLERGNQALDTFQKTAVGAAGAADGFNAAGESTASVSKKVAREVEETHKRVAEYNRRLRETQSSATSAGHAQDALTTSYFRQIDRIKQLGSGMHELRNVQAQLRRERAAGAITQNDYLTLVSHASDKMRELTCAEQTSSAAKRVFIQKLKDQVATQSLSREELLRYRAAQLGVGSAADVYIKKLSAAGNATHHFSLKTTAARRELGVMLGELARGDLGSLRGSGITLANRSGLIEQLMTLRGLAITGLIGGIAGALYGLGKAWYQGAQEAVEFNKQLILTGHHAGKTAAELQLMAKSLSGNGVTQHAAASALAQVVGSGTFKAHQLETVAKAAASMQEAIGQSVDTTIKHFQTLYDSPTKSAKALNKQLHYLTSSQYDYISSLEKRGYKEAAGEAAAKAYSEAAQKRSQQVLDNLGAIDAAINAVTHRWKAFWDAAMNVGRPMTDAYQLEQIETAINQIYADRKKSGKADLFADGLDNLLQQKSALTFVMKSQQGYIDSTQKAKAADDARTQSLHYQNEILSKNQSWQQKRTTALTELWQMVAKAPKDWAEAERRAAVAQINADNKPPTSPRGRQYRPPAGDRAQETAQSELLALQAQLQVLRQHTDVNDVISQQRKRLWTEQGKFAVLEEAATRRQLTGQEKSLLASKAQVLAQKEQLATVGDEVALQERLNRLHDQAEKFSRQQQAKRAEMASLASGATSRDAERQTTRNRISSEYAANPMAQSRALKTLEDSYARQDELERNWRAGALHGMNEYRQAAENTYGGIAYVAQSTLSGISDMMTSLVTTGTASFRAFSASILKMIIEVTNKLLVAYAVQSSMGWISGSLSRPSVGNNPGLVPMGLHYEGGYTGEGGKYEPKGIVHGGEFVFTKEATRNIGIGNLYAMMRQAQGYANGGYVGNTAPMYGLRGASNVGAINVYTPVTLQMDKGRQDDKNTSASTQAVGKQLELTVKAIILDTFKRESSSGGKIHTLVKSMR